MSLPTDELHWRAPAVSLLLAGLVTLERFAWYGSRAVLILWLIYDLGMPDEEAFSWVAHMSTWLMVGPLVAGVLALLTGPHLLYVIGGGVMALAYASLTLAPTTPLWITLVLLMVGQGLVRPTLFAIAGTQFRGRFANLRTLTFAVLYGGVNLGAFLGAAAAVHLGEMYGYTVVFALCAASSIVVTLGGVAVFILDWGRPTEPRLDIDTARRFFAGLLIVPMTAALWLATSASWSLTPPDLPEWVWQVNPAAVVLTTVMVVLATGAAQAVRIHIPALPIVGLALLLGVPAAGLWLVPGLPQGALVAVVGIVLLVIPEVALGTFAMSRLVGDLPSRLSTLLIGLWSFGSYLGASATQLAGERVEPSVLLVASLTVLGAAAIAALALWKPLDWVAYDRQDDLFPDEELDLS